MGGAEPASSPPTLPFSHLAALPSKCVCPRGGHLVIWGSVGRDRCGGRGIFCEMEPSIFFFSAKEGDGCLVYELLYVTANPQLVSVWRR